MFMHGIASICNGVCLQLQDADTLSKVCIGAALEEKSMKKLVDDITPVYEQVISRHPNGRFEQHVYQVHEELKAKKYKVDSYICSIKLNASQQHAIDCIAYCTDMKQCNKMMSSEYMPSISSRSRFGKGLTSSDKSIISKDQVKRCLKRCKDVVAERMFHKEGCFWRSEYFGRAEANERLRVWKQTHGIEKFRAPWKAKVNVADLKDVKAAIVERKKNAAKFGICTIAPKIARPGQAPSSTKPICNPWAPATKPAQKKQAPVGQPIQKKQAAIVQPQKILVPPPMPTRTVLTIDEIQRLETSSSVSSQAVGSNNNSPTRLKNIVGRTQSRTPSITGSVKSYRSNAPAQTKMGVRQWYSLERTAVLRAYESKSSAYIMELYAGREVFVSEIRNNRAHITAPKEGWITVRTKNGCLLGPVPPTVFVRDIPRQVNSYEKFAKFCSGTVSMRFIYRDPPIQYKGQRPREDRGHMAVLVFPSHNAAQRAISRGICIGNGMCSLSWGKNYKSTMGTKI